MFLKLWRQSGRREWTNIALQRGAAKLCYRCIRLFSKLKSARLVPHLSGLLHSLFHYWYFSC